MSYEEQSKLGSSKLREEDVESDVASSYGNRANVNYFSRKSEFESLDIDVFLSVYESFPDVEEGDIYNFNDLNSVLSSESVNVDQLHDSGYVQKIETANGHDLYVVTEKGEYASDHSSSPVEPERLRSLMEKKESPEDELLSVEHLLEKGGENRLSLLDRIFMKERDSAEKLFSRYYDNGEKQYHRLGKTVLRQKEKLLSSMEEGSETYEVLKEKKQELEEALGNLEDHIDGANLDDSRDKSEDIEQVNSACCETELILL